MIWELLSVGGVVICVSVGMFLKGADKRILLFKDEHLPPNVDKVIAIKVFLKSL